MTLKKNKPKQIIAQIEAKERRSLWESLSDIQRYRIHERRFKCDDYYHFENAFKKNGFIMQLPTKEQFRQAMKLQKSQNWMTYETVANNPSLRYAGNRSAKISRTLSKKRAAISRTKLLDMALRKNGFNIPKRDYNNLEDNHVI